jgi:hypothetical protein
MSFLKGLYADLIEKRLWPIAAALLIALVAVPVLLSKSPDETSSASGPAAGSALLGRESAALLGETKAVVSLGSDGSFRKHIGRLPRKNPFVQQGRPKAAATTGTTGPSGSSVPQNPSSQTPASTTPTGTSTPDQTKKLYRYVAGVKFGRIGKTKSQSVDPAEFMPSEQNPVLLFLGADNTGDNALFLVSPEVTARGDGVCVPSDTNCQIVRMKKGDVQFFEVSLSAETVVTYELELVDITLKEVTNPPKTQSQQPQFELRLDASHLKRMRQAMRTRHLKRMRQAMRTKRVFETLDQLGP